MKGCFAFFLLFNIIFTCISSGQVREGFVRYRVTYPGSVLDSSQLAALPSESVTYFKDHMVRVELRSGKGVENAVIADNEKMKVYVMTDLMGEKSYFEMNRKDVLRENRQKEPHVFSGTGRKKTIVGFECFETVATLPGGNKLTAWFTNDVSIRNANWNTMFSGVNGFLMEFIVEQEHLEMHSEAIQVIPAPAHDSLFFVPAGFKKVKKESLH